MECFDYKIIKRNSRVAVMHKTNTFRSILK